MANAAWPGYDRLRARLARLGAITLADFAPLGEEVERILVEDNRKGVLAGTDRDGTPMEPVKYRTGVGKATSARRGQKFGQGGTVKGSGFAANNNLTTAQYKKLTGPPLAPRREQSRVITNYQTQHGRDGSTFFVQGAWNDVISTKGRKFLSAHFKGSGHLPVRNLAGIRPWGRAQIKKATNVWLKWLASGKP